MDPSKREFGNVSRETSERFLLLEQLIKKWSPVINLVSKATLNQIPERHIRDSMQIFALAPPGCELWCDFGSGGGFPGLVVAIMAEEYGSGMTTQLIESDGRKVAFLREAARQLKLNVIVTQTRIDSLEPLEANVVSARALAPLVTLCEFAQKHLRKDGTAIFLKGANHIDEIASARERWNFELDVQKSQTDPSAAILVLRNIKHARFQS